MATFNEGGHKGTHRSPLGSHDLYRYVRTKEDLLSALADRVLGQLELPEPGTLSWQEELAAVFRSVHDLLLANPDIAQVAARQPVAGQAAYRGAPHRRSVAAAARKGAGLWQPGHLLAAAA